MYVLKEGLVLLILCIVGGEVRFAYVLGKYITVASPLESVLTTHLQMQVKGVHLVQIALVTNQHYAFQPYFSTWNRNRRGAVLCIRPTRIFG